MEIKDMVSDSVFSVIPREGDWGWITSPHRLTDESRKTEG